MPQVMRPAGVPPPLEVRLAPRRQPRFPVACVACGREPGTGVTFRSDDLPPSVRVVAPFCRACGWGVRLGRLTRAAIVLGSLVVAAIGVGTNLAAESFTVRLVFVLLAASWVVGILRVWHVIVPPPLRIGAGESDVTYRFRRADYAAQFAEANNTTAE